MSKTKHLQWNKDKNEVHLHDGGSVDAASELQLLTTKLDRDAQIIDPSNPLNYALQKLDEMKQKLIKKVNEKIEQNKEILNM